MHGCNQRFSIKGYGSVFHVKDAQDDVVVLGAFQETLSYHRLHHTKPFMFLNHDQHPVGHWDICEEDGHGLWLEGVVWHPPPRFFGNGPWSLSIGFELLSARSHNNVRYITEVNLLEISLVRDPSNPLTALIMRPL